MNTVRPSLSQIARPRRSAFTLLEIMLVVVIISLLLGAGIYFTSGQLGFGREVRVEADISALSMQLKLYEGQNGFYPTKAQGLEALKVKPSTAPVPTRWRSLMDSIPVDPWKNPYNYVYPGVKNPNSFDLFSSGPDAQPGTADDLGNWQNTEEG